MHSLKVIKTMLTLCIKVLGCPYLCLYLRGRQLCSRPVLRPNLYLPNVHDQSNLKRASGLMWHTHTHPFNGPFSGTTHLSRYQKGKPIWILLKQETVSGNGISWAICKSAPCSRQITTPAPHHSVFYRPDALPAAPPTASKHWKQSKHWSQWSKVYGYS